MSAMGSQVDDCHMSAELRVAVRPALSCPSAIGEDRIVLQGAQPDLVRTIAYMLAQTVALHFYETCAPPTCTLCTLWVAREICVSVYHDY